MESTVISTSNCKNFQDDLNIQIQFTIAINDYI